MTDLELRARWVVESMRACQEAEEAMLSAETAYLDGAPDDGLTAKVWADTVAHFHDAAEQFRKAVLRWQEPGDAK